MDQIIATLFEQPVDWILNMLLNTIEAFDLYLIYATICSDKVTITTKKIFAFIVWGIAIGTCVSAFSLILYKLIMYTSILLIIFIKKKASLYESTLLFVTIFICSILIQLPVSLLIYMTTFNEYYEYSIGITLSFLTTIAVYKGIPVHKAYQFIKNSKIRQIITFLISVTCCAILFVIEFDTNNIEINIMYYGLFLSLFISSIFNLLFLIRKDEKKLQLYEEYEPVIKSLMDSIREQQHNNRDLIQIFDSLIYANDNIEVVREKRNAYAGEIVLDHNIIKLLKSGNSLLCAYVYTKMNEANQKGIILQPELHYFHNNILNETQLMKATGILIDNAIEASHMGDTVIITVAMNELKTEISTINKLHIPSAFERDKLFIKGYSTKGLSIKRGLGLHILKKMVTDQDGQIFVRDRDIHQIQIGFTVVKK